jgi:hypothetical protein
MPRWLQADGGVFVLVFSSIPADIPTPSERKVVKVAKNP